MTVKPSPEHRFSAGASVSELEVYKIDNQLYYRRGDSPNELDIKIFEFLRSKNIEQGFYIECGAANGIFQSNTFLLEQAGWTGILIEADPALVNSCRKHRENNIIHNAALVSSEYDKTTIEGVFSKYFSKDISELLKKAQELPVEERDSFYADIYEHTYSSCLSGYLSEAKDLKIDVHTIKKEVPAATLFSILHTYNIKPWTIDFFSLDVEGMELDALEGLNLNYYRPRYILTEVTTLLGDAHNKIRSFMVENNYREVVSFDGGHDIMYEAQ